MKRDLEYLMEFCVEAWESAIFFFGAVPVICATLIQQGMDPVTAVMICLPVQVAIVRFVIRRVRYLNTGKED